MRLNHRISENSLLGSLGTGWCSGPRASESAVCEVCLSQIRLKLQVLAETSKSLYRCLGILESGLISLLSTLE